MTLVEVLQSSDEFKYQLLYRIQHDCLNFILKQGAYRLWGVNIKDHIGYMKAIWKSFDNNAKPKWILYGDILDYEKQMLGIMGL